MCKAFGFALLGAALTMIWWVYGAQVFATQTVRGGSQKPRMHSAHGVLCCTLLTRIYNLHSTADFNVDFLNEYFNDQANGL